MCTHQRLIKNKYTGLSHYVSCGKCEACLQQKANKRAYRMKCEVTPDKIVLTAALTYDRGSCPYVLQSDIDKRLDILPVYREFRTRRVRLRTSKGVVYADKRYRVCQHLDNIYFPDYDSLDYRKRIRHLAYRDGHVGICYYRDIQLFKKRLAINLKRLYNYEEKFKIYSCSEYGETTGRPHFHIAIHIPPRDEALFRSAISQAWPFASHFRTERYTEVARDMANYLASYVNSGTSIHPFLSKNFKCKHSYSKDYGMGDKLFSLDSILSKIDRRDLSYLRPFGPKGKEEYIDLCIPKYVINRYFPLVKGFSRLTDVEVLDVLRSFVQRKPSTPLIPFSKLENIDYSKDDIHKISVRLANAYDKFCNSSERLKKDGFGKPSIEDYIWYYRQAWRIYKLTNMRLWYEQKDYDPKYMYDNVNELQSGFVSSPDTLFYLDNTPAPWIDNPNEFPQTKGYTAKYEQIYYFRCKERKVNNYVMAQKYYYF